MLLKHSALYLLARGFPGLVNFLAIAVYTRFLAPEEYGRYALVVAGVGFFNVVFFQWLRLALLRFLPAHLENPSLLLSTLLACFFVLATLTGGIGLLLACLWPDPVWRGLILLAVPLLWVEGWFELNLELARSRLQPLRYGLMSCVKATSALVLGILSLLWGFGVYGPLLGLLAGTLLALPLGIAEWKNTFLYPLKPLVKELLRYGLPLTFTFAMAFIVSSSDRFMIAYFLGEDLAGVYSAAYDLSFTTINLISWIIGLTTTPLAIRAFEEGGMQKAENQILQNIRLLTVILVPASIGLAAIARDVSQILLGTQFHQGKAELIIAIISLSAALHAFRNHHFDLAFQLGLSTNMQFWIMVTAGITNLVLNLVFIPRLGTLGAAWATFVAYTVALILSVAMGKRILSIPFDFVILSKASVGSALVLLLLLNLEDFTGFYGLFVKVSLGIIIYLAFWFVTLGFDIRRFLQ
ncbi:oligosaccharide flippase family protein [Moorella sulfitireducens (nom. illeg.)]|uniref:oligosaccharide flippase family protein n=1 Tax=Neomoorella sulfitireducens TaxID=2972948 RepID=UPI0021AC1792|nr:oligosaccharide flippase family protein [Moorella sulfitireducens]